MSNGGMGSRMDGGHWYEYVKRMPEIASNQIIKFKHCITDEELKINTAFIVQAEDFMLAIAKLEITDSGIRTYYELIKDNQKLRLY